jgi:glutathione S-transferase
MKTVICHLSNYQLPITHYPLPITMIKLYHTPISVNSRRVWITLLEKELEFEIIPVNLNGEQFKPEFLAISPFHHVPVLVDDDFNIIESLAILDYLEAKYPTPPMLPTNPQNLAIVRMVEMVTVNELLPAMTPLFRQMIGLTISEPQKLEKAIEQSTNVLIYFETLLGDRPYFGSQNLTLADIVAGTVVPWSPALGIPLDDYPKLQAWCERLNQRPTWKNTHPSQEEIEAYKSLMETLMAARQNQ